MVSNIIASSPRLRGLLCRVLGERDKPEHLWEEFDGEQVCAYCYRSKTIKQVLQPCKASAFYRQRTWS
jgi:hypothetical protein